MNPPSTTWVDHALLAGALLITLLFWGGLGYALVRMIGR